MYLWLYQVKLTHRSFPLVVPRLVAFKEKFGRFYCCNALLGSNNTIDLCTTLIIIILDQNLPLSFKFVLHLMLRLVLKCLRYRSPIEKKNDFFGRAGTLLMY